MQHPSRATPSLLVDLVGIREDIAVGVVEGVGVMVAMCHQSLPPSTLSAISAGDMGTMPLTVLASSGMCPRINR